MPRNVGRVLREEFSSFSSVEEGNGPENNSRKTQRQQMRPPQKHPLRVAAANTTRQSSIRDNSGRRQNQTSPARAVQPQRTSQAPVPQRNNRRKAKKPMKRGIKALHEIKHYQKTTGLLIPRAPFMRTIRETLHSMGDFKISAVAFDAIQEASEIYLTHLLEDAYKCTLFRGCVTLHPKDIGLVRYIRGVND
ncbi:hypothetical protein DMENIID0001_033080 [Sergentomyia squamirostris]